LAKTTVERKHPIFLKIEEACNQDVLYPNVHSVVVGSIIRRSGCPSIFSKGM
jgi:hypothetical protein